MIRLSYALSCSLLVATATMPSNATDDSESLKKGIAIGAAVVAGGIATYSFFNWLFTPSDEQLLKQAHDVHSQLDANHSFLSKKLSAFYDGYYEPSVYSLPLLESLVPFINKKSIDSYLRHIKDDICAGRKLVDQLKKRIEKLHKKKEYETIQMYREFIALTNILQSKLSSLEQIRHFLEFHHSYFRLMDIMVYVQERYHHEISHLAKAQAHDVGYGVRFDVALHVAHHANHHTYPYLHYFNKISSDVELLDARIKSLSSYYGDLKIEATGLLRMLEFIKAAVRANDNYARELQAKQAYEFQQEQLRIQQQLLLIEQQKLNYMHQQNQIANEKNKIKREEIKQNAGAHVLAKKDLPKPVRPVPAAIDFDALFVTFQV